MRRWVLLERREGPLRVLLLRLGHDDDDDAAAGLNQGLLVFAFVHQWSGVLGCRALGLALYSSSSSSVVFHPAPLNQRCLLYGG